MQEIICDIGATYYLPDGTYFSLKKDSNGRVKISITSPKRVMYDDVPESLQSVRRLRHYPITTIKQSG